MIMTCPVFPSKNGGKFHGRMQLQSRIKAEIE
jgi:hypothetical protein